MEQLLNKGPSKEWQTKDFEEISQFIFKKSSFTISVSTLKRLWGRMKYQYIPSEDTLDILAITLNYSSWNSYVSYNQDQINEFLHTTKEKDLITYRNYYRKKKVRSTLMPNTYIRWSFLSLIILAPILYLIFIHTSQQQPAKIIRSIEDSAGIVPFTTKIYYDNNHYNKRTYIKISGHPYELKKSKDFHHTRVLHPGFKIYNVYAGEEKVEQFSLLGLTRGWYTLLKDQMGNKSLYTSLPGREGILHLPDSVIKHLIGFKQFKKLVYINAQQYNLQGDMLDFKTRFKYQDLPKFESKCQNVVITILDENKHFISIQFTQWPCVSNTQIMFGGKAYNGKTSDIPFMNINTAKWNTTRIVSKNEQFQLFVNDSLCFTEQYTQPLGNIILVKTIFYGSGMLDYVKLGDGRGNWVLNDDF